MTDPKNKKVEYWDLFRLDGRLEKTVPKGGFKIPPHLYHKTVEVIPTDKQGHILLTQRAMEKRKGAGRYEFPAGSVLAGEEPFQAARRELLEETGLRSKNLFRLDELVVPGMHRFVYLAYIPDLTTATIRLQEGETMSYRIVSYDQWLSIIASGQFEQSRLMLYTKKVYSAIEELVGHPTEPMSFSPPSRKLRYISSEELTRHLESLPSIILDDDECQISDSLDLETENEDNT